jgi:hypothetical protein
MLKVSGTAMFIFIAFSARHIRKAQVLTSNGVNSNTQGGKPGKLLEWNAIKAYMTVLTILI